MRELLCIGHRGACGHEPENTLRSVRHALALGADGIEIDVRLIDGELVIFHDARLDRTTNGRGLLARKTFGQLRALDAGRGEQIPTLREVCAVVDRRAFLNIELKSRGTARPVAALISELLACGWSARDFLVSSFLRKELRELRAVGGPEIPIGMLLSRLTRFYLRSARQLGAVAVHPPRRLVSRRLVEAAHARGLKVFVYTVNTPRDLARMRTLGVDGVFTDFPERV